MKRMRTGGSATLSVIVTVLAGSGCGSTEGDARPEASFTGRVETTDGSPAAGALVTAHLVDGRTITVYAAADGSFALPDGAADAERLDAWLPGSGSESIVPGATPFTLTLAAGEQPSPGAQWIAALPDGEDKRRFILDCTGCHVIDEARADYQGARRSAEQWATDIARMRMNFGPGTGFPIMSSWVEPESLGRWLEEGFAAAAPTTSSRPGPSDPADGGGAVLTEYAVPVPQDLPHDLAVAADGKIWITGMFTHQMYVLDPMSGEFAAEAIPEAGANPRAVDIDDRGRVWAVLGAPGKVAVHDPTTGAWDVHTVGMYAHSVALNGQGLGWVNGHFTYEPEVIASLDPGSGEVTRYTVPADDPADEESTIPYGLRVGPDGMVWGTQLRGNRLIRLDPATGDVRQWSMPVSHAGPRRPDVAPDGAVWIPLYSANALVRFDPETERFESWDFPVDGALPYVARVDQDTGVVWIGTGHGDVVASFDPASDAFTVYPLPTRGALIRHLDIDEERGEVWFAYGASPGIPGKVLRLKP